MIFRTLVLSAFLAGCAGQTLQVREPGTATSGLPAATCPPSTGHAVWTEEHDQRVFERRSELTAREPGLVHRVLSRGASLREAFVRAQTSACANFEGAELAAVKECIGSQAEYAVNLAERALRESPETVDYLAQELWNVETGFLTCTEVRFYPHATRTDFSAESLDVMSEVAIAQALYLLSDGDELANRSLALAEEASGGERHQLLLYAGGFLLVLGETDRARAALLRARDGFAQQAGHGARLLEADAIRAIARIALDRGEYEVSLALHDDALSLLSAVPGLRFSHMWDLSSRSHVLSALGRHREATAALTQAEELAHVFFPAETPTSLRLQLERAVLDARAGISPFETAPLLRTLEPKFRAALGPYSFDGILVDLHRIEIEQDVTTDASPAETARERLENMPSLRAPTLRRSVLLSVAENRLARGDFAGATRHAQQAREELHGLPAAAIDMRRAFHLEALALSGANSDSLQLTLDTWREWELRQAHPEVWHPYFVQVAHARFEDPAAGGAIVTELIAALSEAPPTRALLEAYRLRGEIRERNDQFEAAREDYGRGLELAETLRAESGPSPEASSIAQDISLRLQRLSS